MSGIDILRGEYPGDDAWGKFVAVFRPEWDLWQEKQAYRIAIGNEEFAIVLTALMGKRASEWFTRPCGALGEAAPVDILKNDPNGEIVIRSLLMRIPQ